VEFADITRACLNGKRRVLMGKSLILRICWWRYMQGWMSTIGACRIWCDRFRDERDEEKWPTDTTWFNQNERFSSMKFES
jgi:hypothetical protein